MTTTKASRRYRDPAKLPCVMMDHHGHWCGAESSMVMRRVDGTTQNLCTRHANKLIAQIDAHPGRYEKLTWSVVKK